MRRRAAYSYRDDPAAPAFDDRQPLFIFDGFCVLCSEGVKWMVRRDPNGRTQFASVQSPLGRALYVHYGLDPDEFDTFLILKDGAAYGKWRGWLEAAKTVPAPWSWLGYAGHVMPPFLGDCIYDVIQKNRFAWFGKRDVCLTPDASIASRFVASGETLAATETTTQGG